MVQVVIKRKLELFGHICRMKDNRKLRTVMMGMMEGGNKRGRPCREWLDDIQEWCQGNIQQLGRMALDRGGWRVIVENAVDTYGLSAHGS